MWVCWLLCYAGLVLYYGFTGWFWVSEFSVLGLGCIAWLSCGCCAFMAGGFSGF